MNFGLRGLNSLTILYNKDPTKYKKYKSSNKSMDCQKDNTRYICNGKICINYFDYNLIQAGEDYFKYKIINNDKYYTIPPYKEMPQGIKKELNELMYIDPIISKNSYYDASGYPVKLENIYKNFHLWNHNFYLCFKNQQELDNHILNRLNSNYPPINLYYLYHIDRIKNHLSKYIQDLVNKTKIRLIETSITSKPKLSIQAIQEVNKDINSLKPFEVTDSNLKQLLLENKSDKYYKHDSSSSMVTQLAKEDIIKINNVNYYKFINSSGKDAKCWFFSSLLVFMYNLKKHNSLYILTDSIQMFLYYDSDIRNNKNMFNTLKALLKIVEYFKKNSFINIFHLLNRHEIMERFEVYFRILTIKLYNKISICSNNPRSFAEILNFANIFEYYIESIQIQNQKLKIQIFNSLLIKGLWPHKSKIAFFDKPYPRGNYTTFIQNITYLHNDIIYYSKDGHAGTLVREDLYNSLKN